jgi:Predicted membrane protein (DUF2232).
MSDTTAALRRSFPLASLAAGLASSLLYVTIVLSFLFLLPVQYVFGRYGRKAGFEATGVSAVIVTAAQGWRLAAAGSSDSLSIAAAIVPPLVLLAALAFMNAGALRPWAPAYRLIICVAVCSAAAVPLLHFIENDVSLSAYLEKEVGSLLAPLSSNLGEGYEASATLAALDPKELVASSLQVIKDGYAALLIIIVGGSWRLGNRASGLGREGRAETPAIDDLHLPYPLLWAFLGSWAIVLAALALKAPAAPTAFAWNCASSLTILYAAQGFGIVTHLFKAWSMPRGLRVAIAIMALLSIVTPSGIVVLIALPLVGVTEIWIPYRKPKGVGA